MTIRTIIKRGILGLIITTGSIQADEMLFTGLGNSNDPWIDAANWQNRSNPDQPRIPDAGDDILFSGGAFIKITSTVTIRTIWTGVGGDQFRGEVIIDGGTLLANSATNRENVIGLNRSSSLIITNGGSATFKTRVKLGSKAKQDGALIIYEGAVRVDHVYVHNGEYTGTEPCNTHTTIHPGGLLDVNDLILNAGVVDLMGGTLIVRKITMSQVNQWIAEGKIIAMGGKEGWKVTATVDESTGWTKIFAEPTDGAAPEAEIILGGLPLREPVQFL